MFKALGDPVRLRLVSLIGAHQGGEVCVCDLTAAFDLTQPTISHHLKVLREAGIIDSERRGTWVYYWLCPRRWSACPHCYPCQQADCSREHLHQKPPSPGTRQRCDWLSVASWRVRPRTR